MTTPVDRKRMDMKIPQDLILNEELQATDDEMYNKIFYRKGLDSRLSNSRLSSFKHVYVEIILNVVNRYVCLCVCICGDNKGC